MPSKSASMMAATSGERTCHRPSVASVAGSGAEAWGSSDGSLPDGSSIGDSSFGVSSCVGVLAGVSEELQPMVMKLRVQRVLKSISVCFALSFIVISSCFLKYGCIIAQESLNFL